MNTLIKRAEVRCIHCGAMSRAQLFPGTLELFKSAQMDSNQQQCPKCRRLTPCNKASMRLQLEDGSWVDGVTL